MPKEPVYIIDASAYIYRAYHAIAPLSTSKGLPTHAVLGFTNILLRVIKEKKPRYIAMAFDSKGPNFRHDLYPDYKANRPPMPDDLAVQIPYIKKIVTAYRIPCLEKAGVEADDLIATASRMFERSGFPVVMVSGDKDLLQMVSGRVTLWDPMKDRVMDPETVKKKYNVYPEELTDFFALVGDSSDNVPGVPGVGPKTAEKLINEFGSLDDLFEGISRIDKKGLREKLATYREQALLSRRLVRLRLDLDIPEAGDDYLLPEPDVDSLRELYTFLEFSKLAKSEIPSPHLSHEGFELVRTPEALQALVESLNKASWLVIDTETTSLDPLTADLVGLSVCVDPDHAWYIPLGHRKPDDILMDEQLDRTKVLEALAPFLKNPDLPKIGHNLKFDYNVLLTQGAPPAGTIWDTIIAAYLLDPSRRSQKLDDLCQECLGREITSFDQVTGGDKKKANFALVSPEDARDYSCEDVRAALLLWNIFQPRLEKLDLWRLFAETEMKLVPIIAHMERIGIKIDPAALASMSKEFALQLAELETRIYALAGESFNINSPIQLAKVLFDTLKLPHGRKTKTGYSTDVKVLEKLSRYHDLPAAVITHRNLSKLKSTYVDGLAAQIHPATGRVHSSFNQTVTTTGRLSSSNPNLQNIPIRTPEGRRIRSAFVPEPGYLFLSADYSQIDLRVLAHYSGDDALTAAFMAGQDVHNQTAAEIFRVNPALITEEMRRVAKTINFGIVYGMSAFGLAAQLNLSRKEAGTFITRYFEHYSGVKRFMEEIVAKAGREGYVTTLLNRRRPLPDIKSSNKARREFAERTAINTPIQGTAADIIKLAMIETDLVIRQKELGARMLLQIHDELVFEVPEDEAQRTKGYIKEAMESVMRLDVPLVVNVTIGKNLAET